MSSTGEDHGRLLREGSQWTEPWGDSCDGAACQKCRRRGWVQHECRSCVLTGARGGCPVCGGAVRWEAQCPVCRGSGRIDGRPRRGVSAFPTLEGLCDYMLARDADLDDCVALELEAHRAGDVDFDADEGALLVIPTEIVGCRDAQAVAATISAMSSRRSRLAS